MAATRSSAALPTVLAALLVGALVLVVEDAAEQADASADGRAHAGVAGHRADGGTTGSADHGAAAGPPRGRLLGGGHVGARREREHDDESQGHDLQHGHAPIR